MLYSSQKERKNALCSDEVGLLCVGIKENTFYIPQLGFYSNGLLRCDSFFLMYSSILSNKLSESKTRILLTNAYWQVLHRKVSLFFPVRTPKGNNVTREGTKKK